MSGLSDIYDFNPEQRTAIARLEHLRRMREVVREWRAHFCSMPTAGRECVTPSLHALPAVGPSLEKAA